MGSNYDAIPEHVDSHGKRENCMSGLHVASLLLADCKVSVYIAKTAFEL